MKHLGKMLFGAALAMLGAQVHALTITAPSPQANCNLDRTVAQGWLGPVDCFNTPNNDSETFVSQYTGVDGLDLVYKDNQGGNEEGGFASSYETTYNGDLSGATIAYQGGGSIECPECWLAVKDGNQTPIWYLFDIGTWNGTDDIVLSNFWPNQGSISHIAIYSNPAPGPLVLMAIGLIATIGVRRLRKAG